MPRKKPFSGKQKKEQLKEKKARKKRLEQDDVLSSESEESDGNESLNAIQSVVLSDSKQDSKQEPDLKSVFIKLSPHEIEEKKRISRLPLKSVSPKEMEIGLESMYSNDNVIDFPKRPPWTRLDSKQKLEMREEEYFKKWMSGIYSRFPSTDLSYFEVQFTPVYFIL